ncbi:hypothetical protein D3C76_1614250 [compost metagenome]
MSGKHIGRIGAGPVAGDDIALVLDSPADQQGAPVGKPRLRPFSADEQDLRPLGGMGPDPFRKTDIVADQPGT